MSPITWERIKQVFHAAREMPPGERQAFIEAVSERDTVAREARRLLELDAAGSGVSTPHLGRDLAASAAEQCQFYPGEVLAGRYEIIRFLARGGAGEVYEAEDRERGARVAIKTFHPELANAPGGVSWMRREVQASRQVDHPNVCRVFDFVQTERGVFFTMELLPGETLGTWLRREGPLTERRALPILRQIAAGLSAAHQAGVVHRDLKPGNIMMVPRPSGPPRVVLTDFGLARHAMQDTETTRMTRTSFAGFGTPAYMSPEQIEGRRATAASDIYAFGVLIFELVTGEVPFDDTSPLAMAVRKTRELAPDPVTLAPGLRPVWSQVIRRCLDANPDRRFRDAREVVELLAVRSTTKLRVRLAQRRLGPRWRSRFGIPLALAMIPLLAWMVVPMPVTPEAEALWQRGVFALHVGEPVAAMRWLDRAIGTGRAPARAHLDLALAWHQLGMYEKAVASVERFPLLASVEARRYRTAVVERINGRHRQAIAALPAAPDWALLADRAYFSRNDAALWKKVLNARTDHPAALFHQAEAAAVHGDWAEAERSYVAAQTYLRHSGDEEGARLVGARRGLRQLASGDVAAAQNGLAGAALPWRTGAAPCERYVVMWSGNPDGFGGTPDPAPFVSERFSGLAGFLTEPLHRRYDEVVEDRSLYASIPLPEARFCSARVELMVRRRGNGAMNDEVMVGAAPFTFAEGAMAKRTLWADWPGYQERLVVMDLDAGLLASVQRLYAGGPASLDVLVSDDSDVDYIKLTLVY